MRVDAHQHFWQCAQSWHSWPDAALPVIHRDFGPQELQPLMNRCQLTHSVLVQAQPDERETQWLLQLATRWPWIAGVVGWVDLADAQAPRRIAALCGQALRDGRSLLLGLRPMLQALHDERWILRRELEPAIDAMLAQELRFDALIRAPQLPVIGEFARRHPALPIVIDHGGKPPIANGALEPWREQLALVARCPNVYCKLSGLATEAGREWQPQQLESCARHILDCFGPERVMWGSDWPVLNLASDHLQWYQLASGWLRSNEAAECAVFGGTARAFYRL